MPIRNCVDLSLLARTVDNARWQGKYNSSIGLAHLVESYMYKLMEKGKVTRSNWEAVLSEEQKECQLVEFSFFVLFLSSSFRVLPLFRGFHSPKKRIL